MAEDTGRRRFAPASALRELGPLAGFLEPGLAALLDPRVTGQHASALELGPQRRIDVAEGTGDAVPDGRRLAGDTSAVDPDAHVDVALVAALHQRLLGDRLQVGTREVLLQLPLVDLDAAVTRPQDHSGDRGLSLPGSRVAGVSRELGGPGRDGRRLILVADQLSLTAGTLLLLGLPAGPLLGVELALRLDRDRIELGSWDDLLLLLAVALRLRGRRGLLGPAVVLGGGVLGEGLLGRNLLVGLRLLLARPVLGLRLLLDRALRLGRGVLGEGLLLGLLLLRPLLFVGHHQLGRAVARPPVSISSCSGF